MKWARLSVLLAFAALTTAPFALGAQGCSSGTTAGPTFVADAAVDGSAETGACVSTQGGPCGGNTANPCACVAGLVCTAGDSGLPVGDVGGTCEPRSEAGIANDAGMAHDSGLADDAGTANDTGECVSSQGGRCGGNTAHPCACASGLVCTPSDGGAAFGDVGGTCE
jgi:hypothetical protein